MSESKQIEPTDAMVEAGASYAWETANPGILGWNSISERHKEGCRRDARAVLTAALNHPDAAGLFECDHTDYVHVDEAANRLAAAREEGWDDAAQHIYNKGWEGVTALRAANPHRPAQELPTEPGAVIIPADGHEYIEATMRGETVRAREATRSGAGGWYAAWRYGGKTSGLASSREITPGTWKVEEK